MSLLDQEVKEEGQKGKKVVLALLLLTSILLILAIVAMMILGNNRVKPLNLTINGENINLTNNLLVADDDGAIYISLNQIGKLKIGYEYVSGEYLEYTENENKGYLESNDQVIQFEGESNKIYKTTPNSVIDYEEFELKNNILKANDDLYIALDDLSVGLNIVYQFSEEENRIVLNTAYNIIEQYKELINENSQFKSVSDEFNNQKAICYNMLIVSNDNGKWGVVDSEFTPIIGNKYTSVKFVESAGVFIVEDNGKYGVISKNGKEPILDLNYEEVNIINNAPLYYQVKLAGKYGIINEKGEPVINNIYEKMGYESKSSNEKSVLVIKNFGEDKINALVVFREGKYGLVNLENGEIIIDTNLDKIYAKNENREIKYYVEVQGQERDINSHIEALKTTVVTFGE